MRDITDEFFGSSITLPEGVRPFIVDTTRGTDGDRTGWERTCAVRDAGFDPRLRESLAVAMRLLDRTIREMDAIAPNAGNGLVPHAANLQALYVMGSVDEMDDADDLITQCEIAIRG